MGESAATLLDRQMTKKRMGRPKTSTRDDVVARIDRGVIAKARYVAETRRLPLAEYLSEILRPVVLKDFEKATKVNSEQA
jgi:hypothetical protein